MKWSKYVNEIPVSGKIKKNTLQTERQSDRMTDRQLLKNSPMKRSKYVNEIPVSDKIK